MRILRLVGAVVVVTGCGGGGGGGTPPPPPPPAIATVSIEPTTGQSINVGATVGFTAQTRDAQGNALSGRSVTWSTSDQTKVSVSPTTGTTTTSGVTTTATGVAAGSSQIRASAGTIQSALVTVTVTGGGGPNPSTADVTATGNDTFSPSAVTIAPGGIVTWTFTNVREHNVTFTASTPTPPQNIPNSINTTASRTFPNAGSYPYTCTLHAGMNGTVNVQ
jgi:plastocyanin